MHPVDSEKQSKNWKVFLKQKALFIVIISFLLALWVYSEFWWSEFSISSDLFPDIAVRSSFSQMELVVDNMPTNLRLYLDFRNSDLESFLTSFQLERQLNLFPLPVFFSVPRHPDFEYHLLIPYWTIIIALMSIRIGLFLHRHSKSS